MHRTTPLSILVLLIATNSFLTTPGSTQPRSLNFCFVLFKVWLHFVPATVLDRQCESAPTPGSTNLTVKVTIFLHL